MSEDRLETVRALLERWNERSHGVEAVPDFFDPAIELESPFSSVRGQPYRGYAGIERWIKDLDEQFAVWSLGPHEVREIGSQVLTVSTIEAQGRASEIILEFPAAGVFDFARDHRVIHIRIYTDVSEARKALGLEQ